MRAHRALLSLTLLTSSSFGFQAAGARDTLNRTLAATGFSRSGGKILHWQDMLGVEHNYESAPPFLTIPSLRECWIDAQTGVERISARTIRPGGGPAAPVATLVSRSAIFALREGKAVSVPGSPGQQRNLDLWAVLADWRDAGDVRLAPNEIYQDYPRTVLIRAGEFGEERLFIDPKTGLPVKLDREEPHYLWGQVHVEYTYSLWHEQAGFPLPTETARLVDGFKEITRTVGDFEFIERGQAPELSPPAGGSAASNSLPLFLQPLPPKKIEVSPRTFLSVNAGYTEGIALIGDTVYVLDATQGEKRAQQDLDLIRTSFPGDHPIVVVVTDLAWPHVAGIRFWVASGARVISHRASKEFLTRVIGRRWTRAPDLLEQRRKTAALKFVPVDKDSVLAGGKLHLAAIDGIDSEGALIAYLPEDRFLWASDYIQNVVKPARYTSEVWNAAQLAGFAPQRVAAMHIEMAPWSAVEALVKSVP